MNGDQVRDSFIQFFESKGHLHMPSASLIPAGDPPLLFTSAGMVPFKPFFTGEQTPPSRRLTSSQKSFRTTDIDEVGDHKHLTFFEMLGNFSIGDYFKEGAVAYAWELVTQVFNLSPDRMFVTTHLDDDEAFQIWRDQVGVPEERIYRYGNKDNWWGPAGNEGATGPCSELHYDGGAEKGCGPMVKPDVLTAMFREEREGGEPKPVPGCHPNCDCERFVELWNLVFMQFYQDTEGTRTPLPAPGVDTGLGLERAATVLQGKASIYETDLFWPIIQKICAISGKSYGVDSDTDYALRVVAEHTRASSFLIGDGVVPGNEGRSYVLRRIIRRAIRYGRRLGLDEPFLTQVAETVLPIFRQVYKELLENHDFILRVIRLEEERFADALVRGEQFLKGYLEEIEAIVQKLTRVEDDLRSPHGEAISRAGFFVSVPIAPSGSGPWIGAELAGAILANEIAIDHFSIKESDEHRHKGLRGEPQDTQLPAIRPRLQNTRRRLEGLRKQLPAPVSFRLSDTYGFPPELTAEIAREHGLEVDMEGFEREMASQRERARAAHAFTGSMEVVTAYENLGVDRTDFVGYEGLHRETAVAAILVDGAPTGQVAKGQQVEVVLGETPFYAEGGGQVGDRGNITGPNGLVRVEDTQSPVAGLIVHRGVVEQGDISLGDRVSAQVDPARRLDSARNHSGTHLLHASLRAVLGPHVRQAGSLVSPDRLRFDFSHVSPLSAGEVGSVQNLANERIRDNLRVSAHETTYAEAVREGALAFFGDRYGDVVRVVSMAGGVPLGGNDSGGSQGAPGGPFSLEVCGGTHVTATGQVGTLFVLGESSIGGGMRRIEAVTGQAAERLFVDYAAKLESLSHKLQTPVVDLEARLDTFIRDTEELRRRLATLERTTLRSEAEAMLKRVEEVEGVKVVAGRTSATSAEAMREMGDFLRARLSSVVVVLAAVINGSPLLVTMVTPDLVAKGLHAGNLARDAAKIMGGGGGGRPEMAQAGGKHVEKLEEALQAVPGLVRQSLSGAS